MDNSAIPTDGIPNLTYNTQTNRITTAGFEYDSAGNQTRSKAEDGTWLKYEYDAANRLKIVKKDDGTQLQAFNYGSTNARLMDLDYQFGYLKISASNGAVEYTEFAGAVPSWTKSYVYLGSSQLSTITPNGSVGEITEYNHPDRLGIRTVTNQTAGTSYEQTTLPFGTALNAETTRSESKRFTSYERSGRTGLDYAVNRTYDSKLGRFTQVDPIKMSAVSLGSPQTLNLYGYCGNDPVNHVDPEGLFFRSLFKWINKIFKAILIAVAVFVAVAAMIVMPALAPALGYKIFAKLFILSGLLLVQALAPPKISAIVGIATGLFLNFVGFSKIGVIVNVGSQGVEKIPTWQRIAGALVSVGAIANNLVYSYGKDKKRKTYTTAQEAAIAFLKRVNPRSIGINRDIATFICKLKNGKFVTGRDQVLGPYGGVPVNDCPKDSQLAGIAHTYARWSSNFVINGVDYNELFSGADKSWNVPNWVATPSGDIHRWNPDTGLIATVSKLPGVGRTRRR